MDLTKKWLEKINWRLESLLFFLSLIITIGAIVYYVYALDTLGVIISLLVAIVVFLVFQGRLFPAQQTESPQKTVSDNNKYWLIIAYFLFILVAAAILRRDGSSRPLISPWEVVDPIFFWFYGLSSLTLLFLLLKKTLSFTWKLTCLSIHYLISAGVAVIVYHIGYGFDPFIHRATMELISQQGAVLPKPPYYLGEYSLIIILHKIGGLSIAVINKWLLPILSALLLPSAFYQFLKKSGRETSDHHLKIWLTILFLPILGASLFISTTPQNLSYLFLALTVLYTLSSERLTLPIALALATTAIHPLTGLPALGWIAWHIFDRYKKFWSAQRQKLIKRLIFLFIALGLPGALFIGGGLNWPSFKLTDGLLLNLPSILFSDAGLSGRENWLLNFIYLIAHNYNLIIIAFIILTIIYFYRSGATFVKNIFKTETALIIALILSYRLNFNDLINYEKSGYANRIMVIIVIFFLPLIAKLILRLLELIWTKNRFVKSAWIIFALALLTTSLYLSYPRFDKYWNSRGYSTSRYDMQAVSLIDQLANEPYLVLSNQQVSAAALSSFGFNHYYDTEKGPIYFYPIPTGGPLYQYYLDMVYKNPDYSTMQEALNLVGVNEGYLIVNKYWHQSGQVINNAKLTADSWQDIENEVYIFQYLRRNL